MFISSLVVMKLLCEMYRFLLVWFAHPELAGGLLPFWELSSAPPWVFHDEDPSLAQNCSITMAIRFQRWKEIQRISAPCHSSRKFISYNQHMLFTTALSAYHHSTALLRNSPAVCTTLPLKRNRASYSCLTRSFLEMNF